MNYIILNENKSWYCDSIDVFVEQKELSNDVKKSDLKKDEPKGIEMMNEDTLNCCFDEVCCCS